MNDTVSSTSNNKQLHIISSINNMTCGLLDDGLLLSHVQLPLLHCFVETESSFDIWLKVKLYTA